MANEKKKASSLRSVKYAMVKGKEVGYTNNHINIVIDRALRATLIFEGLTSAQSLDDL